MLQNSLLRGALAATLLTLAACGGSSNDGSSSTAGSSAASSPSTGTSNIANASTLIALSSANYNVPVANNSAVVTVNRLGTSQGSATVSYTTVSGTATAGTNYTPTSGILAWADGDSSPKTIVVPVSAKGTSKLFGVNLVSVSGAATLGSPTSATVTLASTTAANSSSGASTSSSSSSSSSGSKSSSTSSSSSGSGSSSGSSSSSSGTSAFSIAVSGNRLVNGSGATVQLRGVNMSGLELSSILGSGDPWGYSGFGTSSGTIPDDTFIRAQKCNVVRLPLNEESWLGYPNSSGTNPDPSGNYVSVVKKSVAQYTADGLYVIVDLHWSAQGSAPANAQQMMADSDHSITFWTSVANAFKDNPAVIFELYNEPHDISNAVVSGGGGGWAGYQQMLDAVRATGATNVVLMGGTAWSNDESWWTSNRPVDALNQIAAAHHDYNQGLTYDIGTNPTAATAMLNAPGVPVVITETGDSNSGSSYISAVLSTADAQGYGVVAWALNPADSFGAPNLLQSFTPPTAATTTSGAPYFNWTLSHP